VDWFVIQDRSKPLNPYDARAIAKEKETWATNYRCWWNLPALPEFNTDHPQVREFLWNVATYWIEVGIDGWRLDVPEDIDDPPFWREFRRRAKAVDPEAYLVGEIWHPAHAWLEGDRLDGVMNYVFNRACQDFFGGDKLDTEARPGGYTLKPIKAQAFARRMDEMLSLYNWQVTQAQLNLLGSHDTPRILSILGNDVERLKLAFLCQMTFPGAPCIYYGDEVGMTSVPVPGHEGRATMSWDESDWDLSLRDAVKRYIALRKAHPALRRGMFVPLYASSAKNVYAFARRLGNETMVIVLNNGTACYEVRVPVNGELPDGAKFQDQLRRGSYEVKAQHIVGPKMSPRSGVVLWQKGTA
jgi:neopullulanase